MPTFQKGYNKGYYSIDGTASCKDLYYGLSLQILCNRDMQLSVRYSGSAVGGGYRTRPLHNSTGGSLTSVRTTSSPVNVLDASIEKTILDLTLFQDRSYKCGPPVLRARRDAVRLDRRPKPDGQPVSAKWIFNESCPRRKLRETVPQGWSGAQHRAVRAML